MKVGVIGAGAWGTALAIISARGGADVVLEVAGAQAGVLAFYDSGYCSYHIKYVRNGRVRCMVDCYTGGVFS